MRFDEGAYAGYYTGYQTDGIMNGSGVFVFDAGNYRGIYEGEFADNKRHGQGKNTYANGDIYEGGWSGGNKSGDGTFWNEAEEYYVVGAWRNDRLNGYATRYNAAWEVIYQGDFVNDLMQGHGTYYYTDGAMYTGEWHEDKQSGSGEMMYADGGRYAGGWSGGMRSGEGTLFGSDGTVIYSGAWVNGEPAPARQADPGIGAGESSVIISDIGGLPEANVKVYRYNEVMDTLLLEAEVTVSGSELPVAIPVSGKGWAAFHIYINDAPNRLDQIYLGD
jgi:hypothetical protein